VADSETCAGGGEFGQKWHQDGNGQSPNAIDDFIAAGDGIIDAGQDSLGSWGLEVAPMAACSSGPR